MMFVASSDLALIWINFLLLFFLLLIQLSQFVLLLLFGCTVHCVVCLRLLSRCLIPLCLFAQEWRFLCEFLLRPPKLLQKCV